MVALFLCSQIQRTSNYKIVTIIEGTDFWKQKLCSFFMPKIIGYKYRKPDEFSRL